MVTEFEQRQRNLPHWEEPDAVYFITVAVRHELGSILARPEVARAVVASLRHDNGRTYDLQAYVLMPDHMHMIIQPMPRDAGCVPLSEIMQALKGATSHRINRTLGRRGAFWQVESHDRIIRNGREYDDKWHYLRANPVVAGLVDRAEDWPWTWPSSES